MTLLSPSNTLTTPPSCSKNNSPQHKKYIKLRNQSWERWKKMYPYFCGRLALSASMSKVTCSVWFSILRERERALAARVALFLSGNFGFLYEKQLGDTRAMWYIVNGDKSSHVMDRITSLYNNNRARYLWVASHPLKQKDGFWFRKYCLITHPHPYLHLLLFIQYGTFLSWGISLSSPHLRFFVTSATWLTCPGMVYSSYLN